MVHEKKNHMGFEPFLSEKILNSNNQKFQKGAKGHRTGIVYNAT